MTRPIFLVSDFGSRDYYAGHVRAVLAGQAPAARVVDLTHEIEPFAVDEGAWTIEVTLPLLPQDSVVLGVVDPGVGGARRAIAVRDVVGRLLVGPDNGLLAAALPAGCRVTGEAKLRGSGVAAFVIDPRALGLDPDTVSSTFAGRDLFAPAAAALARGKDPAALGRQTTSIASLPRFEAEAKDDGWTAHVIHIDAFGNVITTVRASQLKSFGSVSFVVNGNGIERMVNAFEAIPARELGWHVDSSGFVAIAANRASAAAVLGVARGDTVEVIHS